MLFTVRESHFEGVTFEQSEEPSLVNIDTFIIFHILVIFHTKQAVLA